MSLNTGDLANKFAAYLRNKHQNYGTALAEFRKHTGREPDSFETKVLNGTYDSALPSMLKGVDVSIFSQIGKVLGTVAKGAVGFATGGPVGAITAVGSSLLTKRAPAQPQQLALPSPPTFSAPQQANFIGPAIGTIAGVLGRVGATAGRAASTPVGRATIGGLATGVGMGVVNRMAGGNALVDALPRGYHYNKALRRYEVAKANGREVQDPRDQPRVKNEVVRNRSMNVLNPRALSRANTRICGFSRIARKTLKDLGYIVSSSRKARSCGTGKKKCRSR